MKRQFLLFLLLAFLGLTAQAQIPAGYYDNAQNKTGDELKAALHEIIKNHHVVSYDGLKEAFAYTDCKPNGKIWDIYSNIEYSPSTGSCGNYEQEGDCWNREHTWPQSWFNGKAGPKSDLFHVYPTDGYVNGKRSNNPYGEVSHPTYTSGNGSKLGPCVTSGYSGTAFEPIDEYKGDIARGFFYMSVRYAGEDSGWSTSEMTNKSEIEDWAMTMLLRWSDNDPVSEKEIARNNAVYGYQNNRNPFIDHPEYARMIWDENWTPTDTYAITCATNLQHGSVSASHTSASEGTIVQLTATPDPGYTLDSWNVYKTGASGTHVSVSGNSFTMPDYAVTVSATFKVDNIMYTVSLGSVTHGTIDATPTSAKSGTTITLTCNPDNGYSLYAWYVFKTGDMNTTVNVNDNKFTMPAFDVTAMATFVQGSGTGGDYEKVTSAPTDWSGEYLIVCENNNVAFNGGLETLDATENTIQITINNNTIEASEITNAAKFTIATMSGGYSIKAANGEYIGRGGNSNGLDTGTSALVNTITYNSGNIDIKGSGGAYLRYNATSDQQRFRYFKSNTYTAQQPIQLYKRTSSAPTVPTHTIHFHNNDGTGSMNDQSVNENEPTTLNSNTFTREGYVFDGWNTQADGTGTYYVDGAIVTLLNDLDLYAQWDQLYTVTCVEALNGTISASPTSAVEDATITLTAEANPGYVLGHWTVTYGPNNENTLEVEDNQFKMPASDVTVSATFDYVGLPFEQKYYLVTSTDQLVAGRTYLIVNTAAGKALGTTQNNNNRSAVAVTVTDGVIDEIGETVCELTLGGSTGAWTFFDAGWNNGGGGYLFAPGSNNYLRTQANVDNKAQWSISITNEGVATIISNGTTGDDAKTHLRYNPNTNGNPLFSCYSSSSPMAKVELYIRSEEVIFTETTSLSEHFDFDRCVFAKEVAGYTTTGGWYTIASPFSDFAPDQIANGDYDLYAYTEGADDEWINYKASPFNMAPGSGYLYAHNPGTTLRMSGTPNSDTYSKTVNLGYDNTDENLKGFNLLGNPTAHAITFESSANVSGGYYYLSNSESWQYEPSNTVPVGRGFLVKANSAGQTVKLNPQDRSCTSESYLTISIDDEKAYVKLTDGVSMPLLDFRGRHSSVYFTRDGKPYIMLVKDEAEHIDLNFQPKHDGEYTLTISNTPNSSPLTPHLIDNLTGANIDLLNTSSYTFQSKTTDYASRFRLVFSANNENDDDDFVYVSNGNLIITGEGTLQIIDALGRQLLTKQLSTPHSSLLTPHFPAGVYMVRLITSDRTKVQKILLD